MIITELNGVPLLFWENLHLRYLNSFYLCWKGRSIKAWTVKPNIKWVSSALIRTSLVPSTLVQEWLDSHPNKDKLIPATFKSVLSHRHKDLNLMKFSKESLTTIVEAINEEVSFRESKPTNTILNGKPISEMTKSELQSIQVSIDHALEKM